MANLSPAEARQMLLDRGWTPDRIDAALTERLNKATRQQQDVLATHPAKPITAEQKLLGETARVFGVQPGQVDMTGPTGAQRVKLGLLDRPENAQAYLGQHYPGGAEIVGQGQVAFQRPDGSVSFANPPGFEWGDVGEFYSREGPAILGGMAGAAMGAPAGPAGFLGGAFAGAGLGEYARRDLMRPAAGGAPVSEEDIAPIAAMAGVEAAGPLIGKLGRAPLNLMAGRGRMPAGQLRTDITNVQGLASAAQAAGEEVPLPGANRMTQSLILGQTGKQVGSTSPILALKEQKAQEASVKLLREYMTGQENVGMLNQEMQTIAKDYLDIADAAIRFPLRGPATGGKAGRKAFDQWVSTSKGKINAAYKNVDEIASGEDLEFDLSSVQGLRQKYSIPAAAEAGGTANVSADPYGRLNTILAEVDKLDPKQTDYKVLKELRSRVGEVIEENPWMANKNTGIARKVYGDLTQALHNPVKGGEFVDAHRAASAMASHRFDVLGNPSYQNLSFLAKNQPAAFTRLVAEDSTVLTDEAMKALNKVYNQSELEKVRMAVLDNFAHSQRSGGAQQAFKRWWDDNPQGARKLFGGKYHLGRDLMKKVDVLNSSRMAKIANDVGDRVDILKQLVEGINPETAKGLVRQVGGKGSRGHTIARVAVHENLVDRAIKTVDDRQFLDPAVMLQEIENLKRSGAWTEILGPDDRGRYEALMSYARLIKPQAGDTGVSLQRAAAVADLRHPMSFWKGVHTLGVNRAISMVFSDDKLAKAWMKFTLGTPGSKPLADADVRTAGLIASGIVNYMNDMGR